VARCSDHRALYWGVFAGRDGFNVAERVYHLRGRRDWVEDIGSIVSHRAGLRRLALRLIKPVYKVIIALISGPHDHDGSTGYFGKKLVNKWH